MNGEFLIPGPVFPDRIAAGRALARKLEGKRGPEHVVVGLARGGVQVAAEVARIFAAPLDAVAVRKVGHPLQPEYGIGAVTPGDGVYVRGPDGLTAEQLAAAVDEAQAKAALLDQRLHAEEPPLDLHDKIVLVVDDGLATGATMVAALRWARAGGAARIVAAIPVAAAASLPLTRTEADEVVCLHALEPFFAVGVWYESFAQVDDSEVIRLVGESRREHPHAPTGSVAAKRGP
jgi:predicted phosphoribosyltransferase